jgi:Ribbon-helix-helix protein, copG family
LVVMPVTLKCAPRTSALRFRWRTERRLVTLWSDPQPTPVCFQPRQRYQWRYHNGMAMTLRLADDETEALRRRAELEHRSMQEVARQAIREYVENHSRAASSPQRSPQKQASRISAR